MRARNVCYLYQEGLNRLRAHLDEGMEKKIIYDFTLNFEGVLGVSLLRALRGRSPLYRVESIVYS